MTYSTGGFTAQIKVGSNRLNITSDSLTELINVLTIMATVPDKPIVPTDVEIELCQFDWLKATKAFRQRTGLKLKEAGDIMKMYRPDNKEEGE